MKHRCGQSPPSRRGIDLVEEPGALDAGEVSLDACDRSACVRALTAALFLIAACLSHVVGA